LKDPGQVEAKGVAEAQMLLLAPLLGEVVLGQMKLVLKGCLVL
jgi:hypothetical protein